jgi:hypothetical protein
VREIRKAEDGDDGEEDGESAFDVEEPSAEETGSEDS